MRAGRLTHHHTTTTYLSSYFLATGDTGHCDYIHWALFYIRVRSEASCINLVAFAPNPLLSTRRVGKPGAERATKIVLRSLSDQDPSDF